MATPSLAISVADSRAVEGTGSGTSPVRFLVRRSGDLSGSSSARWAVEGSGDNPATASDFAGDVLPSGTVSFAAGESEQTIEVLLQRDRVVETDEGFLVRLSDLTGAGLASTVQIMSTPIAPTYPGATRFEIRNAGAFAALKSDGSVVTWGQAGSGGDSSGVSGLLSSGVSQIFSNLSAFAALKSDGSVVTWGNSGSGGDSSGVFNQLRSGVIRIFSNTSSFAALKQDGSVVTWGQVGNGGDSSGVSGLLRGGVSQIFSTGNAFAALKSDGSVVTWGQAGSGGDSSGVSDRLRSGVSQIFSNGYSFAALKEDGSVVTWGLAGSGGDSSGVFAFLSGGVSQIFSTGNAFAALKSDGSVVTWGQAGGGGSSSAVSDLLSNSVSQISSNQYAFAALKSDGSVVTWGQAGSGGDSSGVSVLLGGGVRQIFSNELSFAALMDDGSVVTWGNASYGGNSSAVSDLLSGGVSQVFSNKLSFAALKNNGSVVTWGDASYGGNSSAVSGLLSGGVSQISANTFAFAALKLDGSVVTWGDAGYGGNFSTLSALVSSDVVGFADPFADDQLMPAGSATANAVIGNDDSVVNGSAFRDQLLAFYSFDGNSTDVSGNGNDGTLYGATLSQGYEGQAYDFDGIDDYVQASLDINPAVRPQLTMGAWVKADNGSPIRQVISHDDGNYDRSLGIDLRGGGSGWSAFTGSGGVLGYRPVNTDGWTFLAVTYDQAAGAATLYVDDQVFAEQASLGPGWPYVLIGSNPSFGEFFDGAIDNVFVYGKALSAEEIAFVRANGSAGILATSTDLPDVTPPSVTGVSSPTANGTYGLGSTITLELAFSEVVTVSGGPPTIQLETGDVDRLATYVDGSGTTTLRFSYVVQSGDSSADLDTASAAALQLNGATIKDVAGHDAILTLPLPGGSGSLSVNADLKVAATAAVPSPGPGPTDTPPAPTAPATSASTAVAPQPASQPSGGITFPPQNEEPAISINNAFALKTGDEVSVPAGEKAGVTRNNKVFPSPNAVIVTVNDRDGNPVPINNVLVSLLRNGDLPEQTRGLVINFSKAPIAEGEGVKLSALPNGTRGLFQRFFVQSLSLEAALQSAEVSQRDLSLQLSDFVTYTESYADSNLVLSQGADATYTTALNNVIYGGDGDDAVVVDAYLGNPGTTARSYISLGSGGDVVEVTKAALRQNKTKLILADFNKREDTLSLQAKAKSVSGLGTDMLKITTKASTVVIRSEGSVIGKGSVELL